MTFLFMGHAISPQACCVKYVNALRRRPSTEESPMKPARPAVLACLSLALTALAGTLKCPPDSVKVGTVCIDTYEASVWQLPAGSRLLTKFSVQRQKAGRPPGNIVSPPSARGPRTLPPSS